MKPRALIITERGLQRKRTKMELKEMGCLQMIFLLSQMCVFASRVH